MLKCIIIPAFNEHENINLLLSRIFKNKLKEILIIIVDDSNKNFKTNIKFKSDKIIYLHRGKKLGRGSAVIYGIKHILDLKINVDIFIEMDADLSHDPDELLNNIKFFKKNKLDLLISSRYRRKSKIYKWPLQRRILSFLSNKLSKFILKVPITDYTNGFRIYSNEAAKFIIRNCGKIGDGYIVLSEILVQLYYNNFRVGEIETVFINRVRGKSNVSLKEISSSLIGLYKIWKIKKKLSTFNNFI